MIHSRGRNALHTYIYKDHPTDLSQALVTTSCITAEAALTSREVSEVRADTP